MSSPSLPRAMPQASPAGRLYRALHKRRPAPESDLVASRLRAGRELRVAANFFTTQVEAVWLCRRLRAHPQLNDDQVQLLEPVDASPRRFALLQHRWDALRGPWQRPPSQALWAALQAFPLPGLLLGLAIGLLLALSMAETLLLAALGTLVNLGLNRLLLPRKAQSAPPRHFDTVLQQRLAGGQYAVVLTGVRDASVASEAIAAMRSAGVYWCAETPRKQH